LISRLGRKRRERRAQTQPDHPFAIEHCEYLTDGAFALLRVSGIGSVAPVALVTQGDGPEAFDPLPQPDAGVHDGTWQIAFALPNDVIEPGGRVWLHDGGLYLADLLIPTPGEPEAVKAEEPVEAATAATPEPVEPVEDDPDDDEPAKKLVEAWAEAARLREKLAEREEQLAEVLKELLDVRSKPGGEPSGGAEVARLRDEVKRLENELSAARAEIAAVEAERLKLEESNKSRRSGIARRTEDRAARRRVAELEAHLSEREQRIEELEKDAAARAAESERVASIEDDARQRAATNEDLRALLESEREIAAAARREVEDLRQQLAAVRAEHGDATQPERPRPRAVPTPSPNGAQSPPWSALDDELLARIEKAKALTR
jgi:hypothetical protein